MPIRQPPSPFGVRRIEWVSSMTGPDEVLRALDQDMTVFYGTAAREPYQAMLDGQKDADFDGPTPVSATLDHILSLRPTSVLEVGCSSGRAYRALRRRGYAGRYLGCDVPPSVIAVDRERHPEGEFVQGTAYAVPALDASMDVCFSMYVLEHLVYPERALREMARTVKLGGRLVLLFPDFLATKRLASQTGGLSYGTASPKFRRGRYLDAMLTLFDNRVRLPSVLGGVRPGSFTVNTRPACLYYPDDVVPDYDAVYLSSKAEVAQWAKNSGHECSFPQGKEGAYREHALLSITRR